jgi:hypothetical protein
MRRFDRADTFDRRHTFPRDRADRNIARLHRRTVDDDGACAAESEAAAVARAFESEIVSKHVQQRRFGLRDDFVRRAVHVDHQ